jgi:hypothetical protein
MPIHSLFHTLFLRAAKAVHPHTLLPHQAPISQACVKYLNTLSFLGSDDQRWIPFTRPSALAEKSALDILLAATEDDTNGHMYLLLSVRLLCILSSSVKGHIY